MAWASLHTDLLRCLFQSLRPPDVVSCAKVCRSWYRAASSDDLWLPHLAQQLQWTAADTEDARQYVGKLGVLSLKDIYLYAVFPRRTSLVLKRDGPKYCELSFFVGFAYHPIRHSSTSLVHLARLIIAYREATRPGLGGICGLHSEFANARFKKFVRTDVRAHFSRQHRQAHFRDSIDRQVERIFQVITVLDLLGVTASLYALISRGPSAFSIGGLALIGLPFGVLLGLVPAILPFPLSSRFTDNMFNFSFGPWALMVAYQAGWPLVTEYWWQRLLFLIAAPCLGSFFSDGVVQRGRWRGPRTQALPALVLTFGFCFWRLFVPLLPMFLSFLFMTALHMHVENCGFSPLFDPLPWYACGFYYYYY